MGAGSAYYPQGCISESPEGERRIWRVSVYVLPIETYKALMMSEGAWQ